MLKLTTDRHEASRGLFATAELLALLVTQATDLSLRAVKRGVLLSLVQRWGFLS